MEKVIWKLTENTVIANNSESVCKIKGTKIPVNAKISKETLSLNGYCSSDNSRMNGVCVSFVSEGSTGTSYCDRSSTPFIHYMHTFHITPGMSEVSVKITNASGNPIILSGIDFEIEYGMNNETTIPEEVKQPEVVVDTDEGDQPDETEQKQDYCYPINTVGVLFKKLNPNAVIPSYAHNGDVGMDMTAVDVEYDPDKDLYIYHTGLAMETGYGYGAFLFPRSSNCKTDAYLTNHVGIVDSFLYRGEIQFRYKNRKPYRKSFWEWITRKINTKRALKFAPYNAGDRVGQMVVFPYPYVISEVVSDLTETVRGTGGFGSTGK